MNFKDVPGGFPKSDLLGVTVALIHVAGQILGTIGLTVAKLECCKSVMAKNGSYPLAHP